MTILFTLLPCPFCGSEAELIISKGDYGTDYRVECNKCSGQVTGSVSEDLVIEGWNRRHTVVVASPEPFRITGFGKYLTRNGKTMEITEHTPGTAYPWRSPVGFTWKDGGEHRGENFQQATDLVSRVPPVEAWPRYFITRILNRHYYRADAENRVVCVEAGGIAVPCRESASQFADSCVWNEVTEAEAKSRIQPAPVQEHHAAATSAATGKAERANVSTDVSASGNPESPASPDPDDWVEITDPEHVLRKDIDWLKYENGYWYPVSGMDGQKASGVFYGVRCLLKDRPTPPATKRIPVRLWTDDETGNVYCADTKRSCFDTAIISDGQGGWYGHD